jgi:DNA-binding response OmpR family regulator
MQNIDTSSSAILAIDAETEALDRLTTVLQGAGYRCLTATNAAAALETARGSSLELIICDVNVAGYSGLVMCEQLRQQAGLDEVPLMFLSTAQTPDIIRRTHTAGSAYFLRKPFDAKVLLQLVERALRVPHLSGT